MRAAEERRVRFFPNVWLRSKKERRADKAAPWPASCGGVAVHGTPLHPSIQLARHPSRPQPCVSGVERAAGRGQGRAHIRGESPRARARPLPPNPPQFLCRARARASPAPPPLSERWVRARHPPLSLSLSRPTHTSRMRLSSSTRGFSKSRTVIAPARGASVVGPNFWMMDASQVDPPPPPPLDLAGGASGGLAAARGVTRAAGRREGPEERLAAAACRGARPPAGQGRWRACILVLSWTKKRQGVLNGHAALL